MIDINNCETKYKINMLDATVAVASGLLTDIIYNEIFSFFEDIKAIGPITEPMVVSGIILVSKILIVVFIFLVLFMLITYIFPFGIMFVDSQIIHKIPTIKTNETFSTYNNCKKQIIEVSKNIEAIDSLPKDNIIFLFTESLLTINKLHKSFIHKDTVNQNIILDMFRKGTFNNLGEKISGYEYNTLIDMLDKQFTSLYSHIPIERKNELLCSDYKIARGYISDLKTLIQN